MYSVVYSLNRTQQAWEDARNAQTRGDLTKKPCQSCGTTKNVEAHHSDYAKTTRVRWMCKSCHKKLELKKHSFSSPTVKYYLWQAALPVLGAIGSAAVRYGAGKWSRGLPRLGQNVPRLGQVASSGFDRARQLVSDTGGYAGSRAVRNPRFGQAYNAPKYDNQLNAGAQALRAFRPQGESGVGAAGRQGGTGGGGAGGSWEVERPNYLMRESPQADINLDSDDYTMPRMDRSQRYWGQFLGD